VLNRLEVVKVTSEEKSHLDDKERQNLPLDYQQTTQYIQMLTNIRFLPLTLLPGVAAAAVNLLANFKSPESAIAVGLIGLSTTFGIILYDLHNTALHDAAVHRAKRIERSLMLPSFSKEKAGGLYNERPDRLEVVQDPRLVKSRSLSVRQDQFVAVIYGVAIGGWVHVIVYSSLRALLGGLPSRPVFHLISLLALVVVTAICVWKIPQVMERNRPAQPDDNRGSTEN
jgi:hypothetical protein